MNEAMTTATPDMAIVVHHPFREQLGQAVRIGLASVGGYLASRGWVDESVVDAVVSLILVIVPFLWGQARILKTNWQRRLMAGHLPDSIARVKGN